MNSLLFAIICKSVGILRYFMECVCTFTCILRSVFRSLSSMLVSCTSHVCFSASLRRRDFVVVLVFIFSFRSRRDFCEAHFLQDGRANIQNAGNDFSVERP